MKILIISGFISTTIYILLNISVYHVTDGQLISDRTKTFKKFEFDSVNRGAFNISSCLKEILTCWELVRGDIMCSYGKHKETICGFLRDNCHDYYGYLDNQWGGEYTLFEGYCKSDGFQEWTK